MSRRRMRVAVMYLRYFIHQTELEGGGGGGGFSDEEKEGVGARGMCGW